MNCQKETQFKGCCCTCENQIKINKHPWNKGDGKGSILDLMGYGCQVDMSDQSPSEQVTIFMDSKHGFCELYSPVIKELSAYELKMMHIKLH